MSLGTELLLLGTELWHGGVVWYRRSEHSVLRVIRALGTEGLYGIGGVVEIRALGTEGLYGIGVVVQ
eukprot:3636098-Rhodomonas_salina.2